MRKEPLEHLYLAAAKGLKLDPEHGFGTFDLRKIRVVGTSPERVRRDFIKSGAVAGVGGPGFFYGRGIRRWLINGPHEEQDLDRPLIADEETVIPTEGSVSGGKTWEKFQGLGYSEERMAIGRFYNQTGQTMTYAFAEILSTREQEGFLWLGISGTAKVWWNGEVIVLSTSPQDFRLAGQKIPVHVQEGVNRLLVKQGHSNGTALFLSAHVVDEDGDRLPGIELLLPGDEPTILEGTGPITAVVAEPDRAVPTHFALVGNHPNPFNPSTTIILDVAGRDPVDLAIYDTTGRRVRTLIRGESLAPGRYHIPWDGLDDDGRAVASGVYFVRLQAGTVTVTQKMMLMR